jgi:cyclopropane fatty-acyl-phospholipid synthase-like methyltransferase
MEDKFAKIYRWIRSIPLTKKERRHQLVGPHYLWKMKRDFQISFLKSTGLLPHHYLLDLGCGTLRGGIPIISYLEAGHYYGIEVRPETLQEARKELHEAGLEDKNPDLILSSDFSSLTINQQFETIWAFSLLMHLSDQILDSMLSFSSKHLSPNGHLYANVNIANREEGSWQGFPVVSRSFDFYRQICARNKLSLTDLGQLKDLGHNSGHWRADTQHMLRISKD